MSNIAITVHNIGKTYRLGTHRRPYKTLRETINDVMSAPFRRPRRGQQSANREPGRIWALKDVTFEVREGEVLGLIGRNGAGKSTLLKILARITPPSAGVVELHGRVASLLEVGTGFHAELTGRENIFLSGAILGLKKVEIVRKFDAIVAFAEIEPFIDTPVKHYSSGMYMRLAFAVAAHLEADVLLIDEVLAVGDVHFQKKCLAKMEDVGRHGRTVVFVSHSMPAVTRLCPRAILLDGGAIQMDGPSREVAGAYMKSDEGTTAERVWPRVDEAPGNDVLRLRAVRVRGIDGRVAETIDIREPVGLEMEYDVLEPGRVVVPHFSVHNLNFVQLFSAVATDDGWRNRPRPIGRYVTTGWIPGNFLTEGMLVVGAAANTLNPSVMQFHRSEVVAFTVIDNYEGDSSRGDLPDELHGVVRPMLKWTTECRPVKSELMETVEGPV